MRHIIAASALAALCACTADDQGERIAAASSCGAADVKGIIGYPVGQVHLPLGTDRLVKVGHYDPRKDYSEVYALKAKGKTLLLYRAPKAERMNVLVDGHGIVVDVICF